MDSAGAFDPYRCWLGVSTDVGQPDHYQLLGLDLFEADPATIALAADQRIAYVGTLLDGEQGELADRLLRELEQARECLLDPGRKAEYDGRLLVESGEILDDPFEEDFDAKIEALQGLHHALSAKGEEGPSDPQSPTGPEPASSTPADSQDDGLKDRLIAAGLAGRPAMPGPTRMDVDQPTAPLTPAVVVPGGRPKLDLPTIWLNAAAALALVSLVLVAVNATKPSASDPWANVPAADAVPGIGEDDQETTEAVPPSPWPIDTATRPRADERTAEDDGPPARLRPGGLGSSRGSVSIPSVAIPDVGQPGDGVRLAAADAEVKAAYAAGRHDAVIRLSAERISQNATDADAYLWRGVSQVKTGAFGPAVADCTEAIQLQPDRAEAYCWRAIALFRCKRFEDAVIDCTKALEIDPRDAVAYCTRGAARVELHHLADAVADFDRAIQLHPEFLQAHYGRGVAYSLLGLRNKAAADLAIARRLAQRSADSRMGRLGMVPDRW